MKKIFIAYADNKMAYSLHRIGQQAKKLGFFDEVRLYTPDDVSEIQSWDLMQYSYGGGYWAWKPYVIHRTLQEEPEGTIVFYVDAGCTLKKGFEWEWLAGLCDKHGTVLFEYKPEMPEWEKFGSTSTAIKHWTKRSAIEFYDKLTGDESWKEHNKIWGGCIIAKGKNNKIIEEWVEIVKNHPEIIKDPQEGEEQFPFFAQHKHDQSLLVALSCKHSGSCVILPEFQETYGQDVAIFASRIRARTRKDFVIHQMKQAARSLIGDKLYKTVKKQVKK